MDMISGDMSHFVFKVIIRSDLTGISLNSQMLKILAEFDGQRNVGAIGEKIGLDIRAMTEAVSSLLKANVIAPVDTASGLLGGEFFKFLTDQLRLVIGPFAEMLIKDTVTSMGCEMTRFPKGRASELVGLLAPKISNEEKRGAFKQNLNKKILSEEAKS